MVKKTQAKLELQKPKNFDLEKGKAMVEKVIRANTKWLKEMADK